MHEARPGPPSPQTRVYGYASVSERQGSIINQELREQAEAIATECERQGLGLLRVVSEREPAKGKGLARPGLEYALRRIREGEGEGLMVCDLSRLTRSSAQLGAILQWLVDHDLRLVAIAEGIDTAEHSGLVTARTLIGFSIRERERITARTRRGLELARSKGRAARRPAVIDDPHLRERIQRMREQNMSLQAIADTLNAEGVPTVRGGAEWRPSSLQSVTGYRRKKPEWASVLSGDLGGDQLTEAR
jgi:DNA invertase Pin-like site-specific DNA recombinase